MEWIRNLPNLVKGAIGMVTLVITFVVLLLNNINLGVTIVVAVAIMAAFFLSLYFSFSKKKSEINEAYKTYRFPKYRRWSLVSTFIIPVLIITLIGNKSIRSFIEYGFVGTPTSTVTPSLVPTSPPLSTPTVTPMLFPTASLTSASVVECPEPRIHGSLVDIDELMIRIPTTRFFLGDAKISPPKHEIEIKSFSIDKFEVTNLQYKQFVDETNHQPPNLWIGTNFPAGKAFDPVTGVTWYDAVTYCKWVGKRLPTEAEWELACRGEEGYLYPWGLILNSSLANSQESSCAGTITVGSFSPDGDSSFQISDMLGNVNEWTSSIYQNYPYLYDDGRENPESDNEYRAFRGGAYDYELLTCAHRLAAPPIAYTDGLGFRCAKNVNQP